EGFSPDWGAWNTIGYKELYHHLKGDMTLPEAVEDIKTNTRHLAKYQQNWMGKLDYIHIHQMDELNVDVLREELQDGG
ncbi:tRNA (adenosine(37)-N6)-dimethylallyltransferase MiaA, partial [Candidatus Bipolaricaulota bacterium]|nr:tRNA (adenosine(37)-N6)-dimethylallyltransferase MiaA [Candidatus Bipolaricaulota bacterium]